MGVNSPVLTYNWKYFVGFVIGLFVACIVLITVANTVPAPREP